MKIIFQHVIIIVPAFSDQKNNNNIGLTFSIYNSSRVHSWFTLFSALHCWLALSG